MLHKSKTPKVSQQLDVMPFGTLKVGQLASHVSHLCVMSRARAKDYGVMSCTLGVMPAHELWRMAFMSWHSKSAYANVPGFCTSVFLASKLYHA